MKQWFKDEPGRHVAVLGGWAIITIVTQSLGINAAVQLMGFIAWGFAFNAWRFGGVKNFWKAIQD